MYFFDASQRLNHICPYAFCFFVSVTSNWWQYYTHTRTHSVCVRACVQVCAGVCVCRCVQDFLCFAISIQQNCWQCSVNTLARGRWAGTGSWKVQVCNEWFVYKPKWALAWAVDTIKDKTPGNGSSVLGIDERIWKRHNASHDHVVLTKCARSCHWHINSHDVHDTAVKNSE